jgi:hypothetical protein
MGRLRAVRFRLFYQPQRSPGSIVPAVLQLILPFGRIFFRQTRRRIVGNAVKALLSAFLQASHLHASAKP